jgi:hypothetical protein
MKKTFATLALMFTSLAISNASHVFVSPVSATSTTSGDLWPVSNLVQGPGVGFDAAAPHDRILGGSGGTWVTGAPGGFPSDFIAVAGAPVLVFDLGSDSPISAIHTWGYSVTNANGVMDFSLRFATDADGLGGFGTSIAANPLFSMAIDDIPMQTNGFGGVITTRYVELTALTTHITNGGLGPPAGGDRVGLGEVSFSIPEPSISLLGLLAFGGLALRRRRK